MKTAWLSTTTIKIDGLTFNCDYYGVDNGRVLAIGSKSYNHITAVVDAWSW